LAVNKRKILASAQKHLQKGALDKALKDYRTALKADPKDSNVRLKIGDILLRQGSRDEAIDAYRKVAERFMDDGFDAKAVAIFKQITKIDAKRFDSTALRALPAHGSRLGGDDRASDRRRRLSPRWAKARRPRTAAQDGGSRSHQHDEPPQGRRCAPPGGNDDRRDRGICGRRGGV
jgi:tetratricopeptide (TPR) repeat protein